MSFQSLTRSYLEQLELLFRSGQSSKEATPELSYRPALDAYFRDLASEISTNKIDIIFEPKSQAKAGRPDWRAYNRENLGVYGFIEAKALDVGAATNPSKFSVQVSRYLELGQNLVLTDGIDFIFYLKSENWEPKPLSLTKKPLPANGWSTLTIDPRVEIAFHAFFSTPEPRQCSEEQLVADIALRTSRLAREIEDLVALDPESAFSEQERETINKLFSLKTFLQNNHDPSLADNRPFSDFVAQVLCFGLLYSHRAELTAGLSPTQLYQSIHQYWIDGLSGAITPLRPFQELVHQLRHDLEPKGGKESSLSSWYDDCRRLLSYVELSNTQRVAPDFHKLYERFLEKFDAKTRFDFGAFYTPQELACFVVSMVDQVAKEIFHESIFQSGNKLIDPCCGTGTFIEQILNKLPEGIAPTIIGFEILPAPYALAHYRLSLPNVVPPAAKGKVHILLTNTLSDLLAPPEGVPIKKPNLFQLEQIEARKYAEPPIIAVIGNPPSSDSTKAPHQLTAIYSRIVKLIEDFRPPDDKRTTRQNSQKQLRNDFVRFLRWSADRVSGGQGGIVALVLPESFLEHGTYRYARKWLSENFSHIWALDIDSDQRSGVASAGLFNTLQGRALLVAARGSTVKAALNCQLRYGSIKALTLQQKKERLMAPISADSLKATFPETVQLDFLYRFRPSGAYSEILWLRSWPIYSSSASSTLPFGEHSIFVRHSSALKLAATSLLVHSDRALLNRRTKDLGNDAIEFPALLEKWFKGQSKPPTSAKLLPLRPALRLAAAKPHPSIYTHRPFVNLWAILDDKVLDSLVSMPGGGARSRPEVRRAFAEKGNLAFTVAPSRKDIGEDLHRFVSFCWGVPDNDLCARGNAQVICQLFPDYKQRGEWESQPHSNFDPSLLTLLPDTGGYSKEDGLIYYSYAILCSTAYLDAFAGALFATAATDTIPRLPITSRGELFQTIAKSGQRLAELENPDTEIPFSVVRAGLLSEFIPSDELKLHKLRKILCPEGQVVLSLMDIAGISIFSTDPVSEEIANFKVAGYLVLDEWVKWFSFRYSRTTLHKATVEAFLHLITRIEAQVVEVSLLDEHVDEMLNSPETWIACPI